MKKILFLFIIPFLSLGQCINGDLDNDGICDEIDNCVGTWIPDITNYNCEQFTSQGADVCSSYSGCEWTYSWGGWVTGGSSDCLGTYEVDNGYCDELEITSGCINDSDGILESYSYQCNDIVGSWFSWGCDDDLSVAIPGAPSGIWTIGDLCPESCDECETIINGCTLSDGSSVPNGWSGSGVGDNWCNDCFCEDGLLACSYMDCGGTDCVDDPEGMLTQYGFSCSELSILGCDADLSDFIDGIGFGISVYEICPESCGDCGDDIVGCTDTEACNYDDSIIPGGFDDGSCEYPGDECEGFDQQLQEVVYGYLEENCECELPLSIDVFLKNKEIIKTVNVLGQKSHINSKEQISIYIYDDGSIEKKYILK